MAAFRSRLAWIALVLAAASPGLVALAMAGARYWGWEPGFALQALSLTAAPVLGLAAGVAGVIVLMLWLVPPRGDLRKGLVAVVLAALCVAVMARARDVRAAAPPVHDVATDWRDPLTFSPVLMQARGPAAAPVELDPFVRTPEGRQRVAEINAGACPGALPAITGESPTQAYARAKAALARAGLAPVTDDLVAGRLEATETSRWFRFKEDVAVRVRAEGPGSRIDIRSISRSAGTDGGSNCKRVTRLRGLIKE